MKHIKEITFLGILFFYYKISCFVEKKGIIIVPVADILSIPLLYSEIPFACRENDQEISCSRVHQLLFNDRVTILKEEGASFLISTKQAVSFYNNKRMPQTCWIDKKQVMLLEDLIKRKIHLSHIPAERIDKIIRNRTVLTLKKPFFEPITGFTFSVGTQFVILKKQKKQNIITLFNPKTYICISQAIPKEYCIEEMYSAKDKQRQYVGLIQEWINAQEGFIPYVWGGTSFTSYTTDEKIVVDNFSYRRPGSAESIKTGFDCAGLILRAAQICNLPYFFKNTTTLAYYLKPLALGEKIEKGDLIFFAGHVQIISDTEKNLIIESAGYKSGYGKVHQKKVGELFKNKPTLASLVSAYHAQEKLERLYKDGRVEVVPYFKILRFSSLYR